jgi:hypothetical protein
MPASRGRLAAGLGLVASVAALAAGGIAMGIELERRVVAKRIRRSSQANLEDFFSLRSDGPEVITPDFVVGCVKCSTTSDLTAGRAARRQSSAGFPSSPTICIRSCKRSQATHL